jgi:hypothetical protein
MGSPERFDRTPTGADAWSRAAFACALGVLLAIGSGGLRSADALPPGKAWSTVIDTFKIPGHTFGIWPWRIETDALGRPLAFVEALGGIGNDMYVLRWQGSTWGSVDHLGYGTKGVQPVPSPDGTYHLVWGGAEEIMTDRLVTYLVMSELVGDRLARPDTVTTFHSGSLIYAAAASALRRWAAVGDYGDLRVFHSDSPGTWIETPVGGRGDRGVAVAAIDDTTALVAWRDQDLGPGAGILRGLNWTLAPAPPMTGLLDAGPRFRLRASGGYWLSWATQEDFIGISSYRDGSWSPAESVFCAYLRPEPHYAQSRAEMSRDDGEYPAVSWMAVSSRTGLTSVCVCVPDESGFTVAENLPGSEGGESPVVARDRNQDVWAAWQGPDGMGWTHTYTTATSGPPSLTGSGTERRLTWTLSEAAPGSWWAVLRGLDGEPLEAVARLRADESTAMAWTDASPALSTLHYRIRRECVDSQYEWLSDEVLWPVDAPPPPPPPPPPGGPLLLLRASENPVSSILRFEALNASAGPLDVKVYDLRGRLLLREQSAVTGSGRDEIQIDIGIMAAPLAPGLYFLRAADSTGKVSPSVKVVVLR